MRRGTREYTQWTIAIVLVVIFALLPVVWLISLSLKDPAQIADGRFIPQSFSLDSYKSLFEGGFNDSPFLHPLVNSIAIALITTVIAITLAAFTAYAIAHGDHLHLEGRATIDHAAAGLGWSKPGFVGKSVRTEIALTLNRTD